MSRSFAALLGSLVVLGACGTPGGDGPSPSASNEARPSAKASSPGPARAPSAAPLNELPAWPALPPSEPAAPPRVTRYERSEKPTFVIFFGTWCGGCVASLLADVELAKRFAPVARVGIALMADTDAAFTAFAEGVRAPLPIEVWRDDPRTRELKDLCGIHGLPMACLVDREHRVLWRGEPGNGAKVLTALGGNRLAAAVQETKDASDLIERATASPADTALRGRALAAAAGLGGLENATAWPLVEKGEHLELAAGLARDATIATGGLDFASLDTYAFALFKLGHPGAAVAAATRGIAVCDKLGVSCPEERARFESFKAAAPTQPR